MKIVLRRFLEFFLIEVAFSAVFTLVFHFFVTPYKIVAVICSVIGVIAYFAIQGVMLRHCYFDLWPNRTGYYIWNSLAYIPVLLINVILYFILRPSHYTYFYFITKVLYFFDASFDSLYSTVIFHAIAILSIFMAPIGMKRIIAAVDKTLRKG